MTDDDGADDDDDDDDDVGEDDVEEKDRSQDWEAHFVRACAVAMHMDISQGPFCGNLHGKGRTLMLRPAVAMHMDISCRN